MSVRFRIAIVACGCVSALSGGTAAAAAIEPGDSASALRVRLGDAQQQLILDTPQTAAVTLRRARRRYGVELRPLLSAVPEQRRIVDQSLGTAVAAARAGNASRLAGANASAWAALANAAYRLAVRATLAGDARTAASWLLVREFRAPTKLTRPGVDATLANAKLAAHTTTAAAAFDALRADLLDTYQARLRDALGAVAPALAGDREVVANQQAALAQGFWRILAPTYKVQAGAQSERVIAAAFASLRVATDARDAAAAATISRRLADRLDGFRAAPLSATEERRRASLVRTFVPLAAVEYARGVKHGRVQRAFEVQEGIVFQQSALSAYRDIEPTLIKRDPKAARRLAASIDGLGTDLNDAVRSAPTVDPKTFSERASAIVRATDALFPSAWREHDVGADFDLIAGSLDRLQRAAAAGQYGVAEQARIEAYAFFELGPEQRLRGLAPDLFARSEGLFWYGTDGQPGLATLLNSRGSLDAVRRNRSALDSTLVKVQREIGSAPKSRLTIISNTAIIVFREGLEAVLILAALMASFKGAERRLRRPMWLGVAAALVASVATWAVAQTLLTSLSAYRERLSAIVSLVAIGILLLILNWFFHKTYWTGHLSGLHSKKKATLATGGVALSQLAALATLGFTSVFREGFETVLFMQALVLATSLTTVTLGVLVGLVATLLVGVVVFKLEAKLPYKRMLVLTGVMVTWVLIVMVGTTVQITQKVGWTPVTPIDGLHPPYWAGLWFGFFPTWQGILLQATAFLFVIGSYVAAEGLRKRKRTRAGARTPAPQPLS